PEPAQGADGVVENGQLDAGLERDVLSPKKLREQRQVGDIAELNPAAAHGRGELDKFARSPATPAAPVTTLPDLHGPAHIAQDRGNRGNACLIPVAGAEGNLDGADRPECGSQFGDQCGSDRGGCARAGTDENVPGAGGFVELADVRYIIT